MDVENLILEFFVTGMFWPLHQLSVAEFSDSFGTVYSIMYRVG
jgi:hypothetical protein